MPRWGSSVAALKLSTLTAEGTASRAGEPEGHGTSKARTPGWGQRHREVPGLQSGEAAQSGHLPALLKSPGGSDACPPCTLATTFTPPPLHANVLKASPGFSPVAPSALSSPGSWLFSFPSSRSQLNAACAEGLLCSPACPSPIMLHPLPQHVLRCAVVSSGLGVT